MRIELRRFRRGLIRIDLQLPPAQAQRILRVVGLDRIDRQPHRSERRVQKAGAEIQDAASGGAVRSMASGVKRFAVQRVGVRRGAPGQVRGGSLGVVGAGREADLATGRLRFQGRGERDHAAGRVAIERGKRSAQHLDALGRVQRKVRNLALAVRQGRRNPVHVQSQAAHAERGAGAEAADRDLQVLRIVLAVQRDHAGDAVQCLRDIHAQLGVVQILAFDHVHRSRHLERFALGAGGGDHDDLRRRRGVRRGVRDRLLGLGSGGERECDGNRR